MSIYSLSRYVANRAIQGATGMKRQRQDHSAIDTPREFNKERATKAMQDVAQSTRQHAGAYRITISQAAMQKVAMATAAPHTSGA